MGRCTWRLESLNSQKIFVGVATEYSSCEYVATVSCNEWTCNIGATKDVIFS